MIKSYQHKSRLTVLGVLALATVVAACGGGGGTADQGPQTIDDINQSNTVCKSFKAKKTTTTISVREKLDLVFVVDKSGSMCADNARVAAGVEAAVASLLADNYDVRMGVTWTANSGVPNGTPTGELKLLDATRRWVDLDEANAGILIRDNIVAADCNGSGTEKGTEAALNVLLNSESGETNAGFQRAGAHLAFVMLTDEQDDTGISDALVVDQMLPYVASNADKLHWNNIFHQVGLAPTACFNAGAGDEYGDTYDLFQAELSSRKSAADLGVDISICTTDFTPAVLDIVSNSTTTTTTTTEVTTVSFASVGFDPVASGIRVYSGDERFTAGPTTWEVDEANEQIILHSEELKNTTAGKVCMYPLVGEE